MWQTLGDQWRPPETTETTGDHRIPVETTETRGDHRRPAEITGDHWMLVFWGLRRSLWFPVVSGGVQWSSLVYAFSVDLRGFWWSPGVSGGLCGSPVVSGSPR